MYTLNITKAIRKISVNENYYKQIGFSKKNSYCSSKCSKKANLLLFPNKLIEKVPDPSNSKQHYESFLRKKSRKSVKRSEIINYQPKTFQNLSIVDITSVITEHPKTAHKLSKVIRKSEKVDSNSIYIVI